MYKRICIIVQSHYDTDARVQREVSALVEAGYEVDIICLRNKSEPYKQFKNGATIYGIPIPRKRGSVLRYMYEYGTFTIIASWLVLLLMLKRKYRIVQVCNLPDILILAALVPKFLGARILFDAHEGALEAFLIHKQLKFYNKMWIQIIIWIEHFAFYIADQGITVHAIIREHFIRRGIKGGKICVVMNLPSLQIFSKKFNRKQREGRTNCFTLIYAGSITRPYGLHTAIQALPLLSDIPGLKLRIIGNGNSEYKKRLIQLAEKLGVSDRVFFEPSIPHERVPHFYAQADIGISPHTGGAFGEICFSNKVLEYLACGLPAVVSRTPVYEYYFTDSEIAFCEPDDFVSFAQKVRAIFNHSDYAQRLKRDGFQKIIKELNWEKEKTKYINIINKLFYQ